jgi:hypothetical protein
VMGGSSGGGGGSGAVSYPAYMQDWHTTQLGLVATAMGSATSPYSGLSAYDPGTDLVAVDTAVGVFKTALDTINDHALYDTIYAQADSIIDATLAPTLYVPTTDVAAMSTVVSTFKSSVDALAYHTDFDTMSTAALSEANNAVSVNISSAIHDFSDALDTEYTGKLTPAFEGGMRDINAIMSSAFVLGTSLLATEKANKISKYGTDVTVAMLDKRIETYTKGIGTMAQMNKDKYDKLKEWATLSLEQKKTGIAANNDFTGIQFKQGDLINQAVSEMLRLFIQKVEFTRTYAALVSDTKRIKIAAENDEGLENKAIDVNDAKWALEKFQYGANMLAAIGGGTAQPPKMEGSQMARIIGSGLSGAAAGSMIGSRVDGDSGGGWGAVVGGIGGLLAGAM